MKKLQIFISHFVFRRQPSEFFFSNQIRQMQAGQNNKQFSMFPVHNKYMFVLFVFGTKLPKKTIIICCALGENNLKKKYIGTPKIFSNSISRMPMESLSTYLVLFSVLIHIQQLCNSLGAQIKFNVQDISLQSEQSNSFLFLLIMWVLGVHEIGQG